MTGKVQLTVTHGPLKGKEFIFEEAVRRKSISKVSAQLQNSLPSLPACE